MRPFEQTVKRKDATVDADEIGRRLSMLLGDSEMESKTERGVRERTLVNVTSADDIKYWTEQFGATDEELCEAVTAVGKSVVFVQAYLKEHRA